MSDTVMVPTSGPEEFAAIARELLNDLVVMAGKPEAAGLADWEKMMDLAAAVPEYVTAKDLKLFLSMAVVMLAEARAKQRAESAQLIRDELVCPCRSFEKMEAIPYVDGKPTYAHRTFRASHEYHDICFFAEWSAVIVEKGPRD